MICPNCGTQLPDDAKFCTECGLRIEPIPQTPYIPGADESEAGSWEDPNEIGYVPAEGAPKRRNAKFGIILAVVVLALLAGGGFVAYRLISNARHAATHTPHPITFRVSISGFDEGASRIPISIAGTDLDGNAVDRTAFLAYSGVDTELLEGTYHIKVAASPIAADGTIYNVVMDAVDLTLGNDLETGEAYEMPEALTFVFVPIEPAEVTDEQIAEAVSWARKDEGGTVNVDALEQAAKSRRDDAVKAQEEEAARQEEAKRKAEEEAAAKEQAASEQKAIAEAEAAGKQVLSGTVRVMTGYEIGDEYGFDAEMAVGSEAADDWVLLVFDEEQDVTANNGDGIGSRTETLDRIRLPKSAASADGKHVTMAVDDLWFASDTLGAIAMAGAGEAEILF